MLVAVSLHSESKEFISPVLLIQVCPQVLLQHSWLPSISSDTSSHSLLSRKLLVLTFTERFHRPSFPTWYSVTLSVKLPFWRVTPSIFTVKISESFHVFSLIRKHFLPHRKPCDTANFLTVGRMKDYRKQCLLFRLIRHFVFCVVWCMYQELNEWL